MGRQKYFYVTPLFKEILGLSAMEGPISLDVWLELLHPDDRLKFQVTLNQSRHLNTREVLYDGEYRIHREEGNYTWIKCRWLAQYNAKGKPVRHIGLILDITHLKCREEALIHNAYHDSLTGLPNRSLLKDRLDQLLVQFKLNPDSSFAFAFIDVDHFKEINDEYGHQVGDDVLMELSSRLRGRLRSKDTVSRFGGDEFAIILNDIKEITDLEKIFSKLIVSDSNSVISSHEQIKATLSVGFTLINQDNLPESIDEVIRQADIALYASKHNGRNQYTLYHRNLEENKKIKKK